MLTKMKYSTQTLQVSQKLLFELQPPTSKMTYQELANYIPDKHPPQLRAFKMFKRFSIKPITKTKTIEHWTVIAKNLSQAFYLKRNNIWSRDGKGAGIVEYGIGSGLEDENYIRQCADSEERSYSKYINNQIVEKNG